MPRDRSSLRQDHSNGGPVNRMLAVGRDRLLSIDKHPAHSIRRLGAWTVYFSLDSNSRVSLPGICNQNQLAVIVAPWQPHVISAPSGSVGVYIIEADTVMTTIGSVFRDIDASEHGRIMHKIADKQLKTGCKIISELDEAFFAGPIRRSSGGQRIRNIINIIKDDPNGKYAAQDCAEMVGLSLSRFLYLFRLETNMTFRRYCGWRRVRCVFDKWTTGAKLVELALELGYADSSHFCHAVRQHLGYMPKELDAMSMDLPIIKLRPE